MAATGLREKKAARTRQQIVDAAAKLWALRPGDLIYTGTPENVGPLVRGDRVEATIGGLEPLNFTVV